MLQLEKSAYQKSQLHLKHLVNTLPNKIKEIEDDIAAIEADIGVMDKNHNANFYITLGKDDFVERTDAAERLSALLEMPEDTVIGSYRGLTLKVAKSLFWGDTYKDIALVGAVAHHIETGSSPLGNITRIENCYDSLVRGIAHKIQALEQSKADIINAESELKKPFDKEPILRNKLIRQAELNTQIELEQSGCGDNIAAIENVESKDSDSQKSNDHELEL